MKPAPSAERPETSSFDIGTGVSTPGAQRSCPPSSLHHILDPRTVVVMGASEVPGTVGHTILANLLASSFGGRVIPVDPGHHRMQNVPTVPGLGAIPQPIDLVVIAGPAQTIPDRIDECVQAGVAGAVILSAGFKELGREGTDLERQVLATARRGNLRIIGAKSLGVMNPVTGLNATFAIAMATPGNIALLSQSGSMCSAIIDWSRKQEIGFSGVVSLGTMMDVGWGDLIDHFGSDPHTRAIILCLEEVGDARVFYSAAREVAVSKPILVLKGGRTSDAARACAAHSVATFEPDEAFDALCQRAGVMRVAEIQELFSAAELLSTQTHPPGRRIAIVTNAGGPSVLAVDVIVEGGGSMAQLAPATNIALDALLPEAWSHGNPVDLLDDATPDRFGNALSVTLADPGVDGVMVVLSPQGMTDPTQIAEVVADHAHATDKPVIACWMGGIAVSGGRRVLRGAGIPDFTYPEQAAWAWNTLCTHGERFRLLYEMPTMSPWDGCEAPDRDTAAAVIGTAIADGRTRLGSDETRRLLAAYHLTVGASVVATTDLEAIEHAEHFGYPVILSTHHHGNISRQIGSSTHVRLRVDSVVSLRIAFHAIRNAVLSRYSPDHFQGIIIHPTNPLCGGELAFAMAVDPHLGPLISVGLGGRLKDVYHDRAIGLPPLTSVLAQRLIDQLDLSRVFGGLGGAPSIEREVIEQALVRFSQLVAEQPRIKQLRLDPMIALGGRMIALDAVIDLHDGSIGDKELPRTTVRPYPVDYCSQVVLKNGIEASLRPVRPEDEQGFIMLHQQLSPQTVRFRYLTDLPLSLRIAHENLVSVCHIDYDRAINLVAEIAVPGIGNDLIGVGRLHRLHGGGDAEATLLVADRWQNCGLGTALLAALIKVATGEGLQRLIIKTMAGNSALEALFAHFGFVISKRDGQVIHAELKLSQDGSVPTGSATRNAYSSGQKP